MVMNLVLSKWETLSLKSGCNLYSKGFRFCVLTVKKAHQNLTPAPNNISTTPTSPFNMYFRERDRPAVDIDTFLATALPKMLIATLIIFLNALAILGLVRSNRWMSSISSSGGKGFYFLPQSTQGLLHSLFLAYLALGLLTLYSQVSLSAFVLLEFRVVEDQGAECLVVNSALISLSIAISLHIVSLAVDRTLAAYLSYSKYTDMARGTVPLWLLAIWLPSLILGALPLAGWRKDFSFCIFLHQFNDDYLRFVGGFYFASVCSMPLLYFYFLCFLKPHPTETGTLYRWHRKLQSHHRLTFISTMALNTVCWAPFHLYLLLACLSCSFPLYGTGFLQEYLYIIALIPAMGIPMMFTIRGSVLDQCAAKISRMVHFREVPRSKEDSFIFDTNPLSRYSINKKSPLFFIDEHSNTTGSSSIYRDTLTSKQKGNLFVPRYLPMDRDMMDPIPGLVRNSGVGGISGKYTKNPRRSGGGRGFANGGYVRETQDREHVYANSPSTQETDSQCGFPMTTTTTSTTTTTIEDRPGSRHSAQGQRSPLVEEMQDEPYYSQILNNTLPRR